MESNKKYSILILIFFFITSCEDKNPYISNDLDSINYTSFFQSLNSGQDKYSVLVKWRKSHNDNINYTLLNSDDSVLFSSVNKSDTSYIVPMSLNQFKNVKLNIDDVLSGEINIFTRPISPATDLTIQASSQSNTLTWSLSSDSDILQTIIYRSEIDPSSAAPLINDTNGTPDTSIWNLVKQGNGNLSSFIDTSINTSFNYYYIIKLIDSSNNYRYSHMVSNIIGSVESISVIGDSQGYQINFQSSEALLSEIYPNKISIFWQDYNYDDFYSFEIWRSDQSDFIIGADESNFIVESTNPLFVNFNDYNDIGQGKTWYYKLRINNIYGNFIDSETLTCRTTL